MGGVKMLLFGPDCSLHVYQTVRDVFLARWCIFSQNAKL